MDEMKRVEKRPFFGTPIAQVGWRASVASTDASKGLRAKCFGPIERGIETETVTNRNARPTNSGGPRESAWHVRQAGNAVHIQNCDESVTRIVSPKQDFFAA